MKPKVSIIIPYDFDRGYLNEAIKSVENQTYKDWELILSCSEGSGGHNMNKGIEKAKGDYICYLCEDDLLPPNSLENRLESIKGYDFIHGRGEVFRPNGDTFKYQLTNPYAELSSMLIQNGIMGGTMLYKREIFDQFKWDESLWTGGEYDFNLKLLFNSKRLGFSNEVVYRYRRHHLQKSLGNPSKEYQALRQEQIELIRNRYR